MSNCELQTEVGQLYATVKQLAITTEELMKEILDIRKDYATIMVSHTQLQTQIYNFASLVTGQNGVQNRHETPESPRSPPTLSTDDMCGTEVAWTM